MSAPMQLYRCNRCGTLALWVAKPSMCGVQTRYGEVGFVYCNGEFEPVQLPATSVAAPDPYMPMLAGDEYNLDERPAFKPPPLDYLSAKPTHLMCDNPECVFRAPVGQYWSVGNTCPFCRNGKIRASFPIPPGVVPEPPHQQVTIANHIRKGAAGDGTTLSKDQCAILLPFLDSFLAPPVSPAASDVPPKPTPTGCAWCAMGLPTVVGYHIPPALATEPWRIKCLRKDAPPSEGTAPVEHTIATSEPPPWMQRSALTGTLTHEGTAPTYDTGGLEAEPGFDAGRIRIDEGTAPDEALDPIAGDFSSTSRREPPLPALDVSSIGQPTSISGGEQGGASGTAAKEFERLFSLAISEALDATVAAAPGHMLHPPKGAAALRAYVAKLTEERDEAIRAHNEDLSPGFMTLRLRNGELSKNVARLTTDLATATSQVERLTRTNEELRRERDRIAAELGKQTRDHSDEASDLRRLATEFEEGRWVDGDPAESLRWSGTPSVNDWIDMLEGAARTVLRLEREIREAEDYCRECHATCNHAKPITEQST